MSGEASLPFILDIKNLILESNNAITEKIDGVAITVALLCQDIGTIRERVKYLSTRANGAEELMGTHTSQLADQERHLQQQEAKLANLKDRSRVYTSGVISRDMALHSITGNGNGGGPASGQSM
ncbi:hypothetical protein NDU88_006091 [Pleurodeles waltl]|uniref:Uncharacterized protein n=1 Tax=Pleurodeles waltl TaxID=8319 RepID=A0AAV7VNM3_PLEWA|nr:hypothetical protein NDU88_006091 [Pleurodeles waltl]